VEPIPNEQSRKGRRAQWGAYVVNDSPAVSFVVPCFNEAAVLPEALARMHAAARDAALDYEIVVVDDGSSDSTWQVLEKAASADHNVRGIRLSRNFGHQAALTAGLERARGSQVLILDADLQDPPELISAMRAKMEEGYDVVYGKRRFRDGESWVKRASAACFYRLLNFFAEIEIPSDSGDFRLMNRRALDAFLKLPEASRYIRGMVAWIGFRQVAFEYHRHRRAAGKTKYGFGRMVRLSMDALTGFSIRPLRVASIASVILIGISAMLMIRVLLSWATGGTVRGWTSLIVTVLFIGGVQTFILGILGEYIGRLFVEAKRRPLYLVSDETRPAG